MKSISQRLKYAALTLTAASGFAFATVTFDADTGTGFVGKGDVQTAFGWNNAKAQQNIPLLTFTLDSIDVYSAVCEWTTVTGKGREIVHDITIPRHVRINDTVAFQSRSNKQIDGIFLVGFGTVSQSGTVPVVGQPCVSAHSGQGAVWVEVVLESSTGETLSVWYNGLGVPIFLVP